jgi:hypothetical protein
MNVKHLVVALAVGVIGSRGAFCGNEASPAAPLAAVDPYRYVVSVGCGDPNGRTIVYVWHPGALPDAEGDRVFKVLAVPDIEECLSEIARTTSGLFERLANLGPKSSDEVRTATMREVSNLWSQHGVYEAVREVAATGTTGPKLEALLHHCDELRHGREQAAGEQRQ